MVQQGKKTRIKIIPDYFYIMDLKDPLRPKVLRDLFELKVVAKACFKNKLDKNKRYFIVTGEFIKEHKKDLQFKKPPYSTKVIKHDYRKIPVFSDPGKVRLRVINRRRLRKQKAKEWGLKRPKVERYEYPEGCVTYNQKKAYRVWYRRQFYKKIRYIY